MYSRARHLFRWNNFDRDIYFMCVLIKGTRLFLPSNSRLNLAKSFWCLTSCIQPKILSFMRDNYYMIFGRRKKKLINSMILWKRKMIHFQLYGRLRIRLPIDSVHTDSCMRRCLVSAKGLPRFGLCAAVGEDINWKPFVPIRSVGLWSTGGNDRVVRATSVCFPDVAFWFTLKCCEIHTK